MAWGTSVYQVPVLTPAVGCRRALGSVDRLSAAGGAHGAGPAAGPGLGRPRRHLQEPVGGPGSGSGPVRVGVPLGRGDGTAPHSTAFSITALTEAGQCDVMFAPRRVGLDCTAIAMWDLAPCLFRLLARHCF